MFKALNRGVDPFTRGIGAEAKRRQPKANTVIDVVEDSCRVIPDHFGEIKVGGHWVPMT